MFLPDLEKILVPPNPRLSNGIEFLFEPYIDKER